MKIMWTLNVNAYEWGCEIGVICQETDVYEYEKWGEHSDYTEWEWICVINWSHEDYEGIKWSENIWGWEKGYDETLCDDTEWERVW